MLHVRLISSLRRNNLLFFGAGINLSLDIVLNLVCMKYWGVAGIALATSLYYVVSCTFVVFAAQWALKQASCATGPTLRLRAAAMSAAAGSVE
jgi:putative peptidoglycan lipid II flippase